MGIKVQFNETNDQIKIGVKNSSVLLKGEDGATFIPEVSQDGILSWTNDKSLENPAPVNIKGPIGPTGPKGESGADGAQGIQGPQGPRGEKGDKGDKGDPGKDGVNGTNGRDGKDGKDGIDGRDGVNGVSATHRWEGTTLYVSSASGTSSADLKGEPGAQGPQGVQGIQGVKGDKGDKGDTGPAGPQGPKGADGTMTFEDLTPEQKASLKGDKGDKGDPGADGKDGPQGPQGPRGATGNSGVYVGSGEMPADCNVQIDPTGEPVDLQEYETRITDLEETVLRAENTNEEFGIAVNEDGILHIVGATETEIYERKSYKPITPANLAFALSTIQDGKTAYITQDVEGNWQCSDSGTDIWLYVLQGKQVVAHLDKDDTYMALLQVGLGYATFGFISQDNYIHTYHVFYDGKTTYQKTFIGQKKYELIETITIQEEIQAFTRSKEPNGANYNLEGCMVRAIFPANSTKGGNVSASVAYNFGKRANGKYVKGIIKSLYNSSKTSYGLSRVWLDYGRWNTGIWECVTSTDAMPYYYENAQQQGLCSIEDGYITALDFWCGAGIDAGTTIEIWGVRA